MIIRMKYLVFLFLLCTTVTATAQDSIHKRNLLKFSVLGVAFHSQLQYERVLSEGFTIGVIASGYYWLSLPGVKVEPHFRYYFKRQAPSGWYIEPKLSIGYFQTQEPFEQRQYTYNSSDSLISERLLMSNLKKNVSFMPAGITLKVGVQKFLGSHQRWVLDYNIGLQCFPMMDIRQKPLTDYNDRNEFIDEWGNRIVTETVPREHAEGPPKGLAFWYLFGAGSFINTNLSFGYRF